MAVNFLVFLAVCLLVLLQEGHGQSNKFIVSIAEYTPPSLTPSTFRCAATVITPSHVLSTAVCADVQSPFALSIVIIEVTGTTVIDCELRKSHFLTKFWFNNFLASNPIKRAFIHPDYVRGQNSKANVAVIQGFDNFATQFKLSPMPLGELVTNSTCQLFGWGGAEENPISYPVVVYGSQFCNQTVPQASCSMFDSPLHLTCSALTGSPLVCNNSRVDGFIVTEGLRCTAESNRLYYHSVGDFREWIEHVSGAEIKARLSISIILSALVISLKSFV